MVFRPVPRRPCETLTRDGLWTDIYRLQEPLIITQCPIGPCASTWDAQYLKQQCGQKEVSVHVAEERSLNFVNRNFQYRLMKLADAIDCMAARGERSDGQDGCNGTAASAQWLSYRALGERPYKDVASLQAFGKAIEGDFCLPEELRPPDSCLFSTVLRLATPGVRLWAHYDVPDNFLAQVKGTKRVLLFPPTQVGNLYIRPQDSSSPVVGLLSAEGEAGVDFDKYPRARAALDAAWEGCLSAGDVLFIPALWLHTVEMRALDHGDLSISVNVFFHSPLLIENKAGLFDGKDIYGNKDLVPFVKAMKTVDSQVMPLLRALPEPYRQFYFTKLASSLEEEGRTQADTESKGSEEQGSA
ncbi:unnamed protein product [Vitrella brassicaformis CCMP3155]|uniref:JmjC domain-containing protein n=1 Tax=Vitrella brassicaformis (strain CCMP3155) TaxID=1169540 RepID=A0A0G4EFH2_VITBC|nr:unnamed protein product [Vitrella brassicaformis CCMP3155]|mmetsp:Transcript_23099/g.57112  ORF Transcript_23099/g.57112 Transcript_23099/m.57112 type:complete len:357 (-) Transcript_23099:621-1691(-)|eukprot:CEL94118.1 unnamed protein product [Vitrella brassicaformis CCMP3155]